MSIYTLQTSRLGLRNWLPSDLPQFIEMNQDETVMEFFPKTLKAKETKVLFERMVDHFNKYGFTYFAADNLADRQFIGFIGIKHQTYKAHFTPCVDIGWRLRKEAWGKGFATEGAKACLDFGFNKKGLKEIYSVAPLLNDKSENVMKKIGLKKIDEFLHPSIDDKSPLKKCCLYKINKSEHRIYIIKK